MTTQIETMSNPITSPKGRRAGIAARGLAALLFATAAVGIGASPAAAAVNDSRIAGEQQISCLGATYGRTPSVKIIQPWVIGTRSSYETISWMPFLEVYTSTGWKTILRSADFLTFSANNQGPNLYYFTNQPRTFTFANLATGSYYRIVHYVHWGSTGEVGTKPSDFRTTAGYCKL